MGKTLRLVPKPPPRVNGDSVRKLRQLLREIQQGEVRSFMVCWETSPEKWEWRYDAPDPTHAIGQLEIIKHNLLRETE